MKSNLDPSKDGAAYLSAIVALGHIAYHLPDKFPIHIKNLVSRKIVKELLMQDRNEVRTGVPEVPLHSLGKKGLWVLQININRFQLSSIFSSFVCSAGRLRTGRH